MKTPSILVTKLLKQKPYLHWWVKNKDTISLPSAVEAILNYGEIEDVQLLIQETGFDIVHTIFLDQIQRSRCNYKPQVKHYFTKFFQYHA